MNCCIVHSHYKLIALKIALYHIECDLKSATHYSLMEERNSIFDHQVLILLLPDKHTYKVIEKVFTYDIRLVIFEAMKQDFCVSFVLNLTFHFY